MLKKIKNEEKEKKICPNLDLNLQPYRTKKSGTECSIYWATEFQFTKSEKQKDIIHYYNFLNPTFSKFFLKFLVTFWFLDNIYHQFPLRYFNDQSTDSSQCKKKLFLHLNGSEWMFYPSFCKIGHYIKFQIWRKKCFSAKFELLVPAQT